MPDIQASVGPRSAGATLRAFAGNAHPKSKIKHPKFSVPPAIRHPLPMSLYPCRTSKFPFTFTNSPRRPTSSSSFHPCFPFNQKLKLFHLDSAPLDDAFQRPNRDRFGSVEGHNHLSPVRISPLLVAAGLVDFLEPVPTQNPRHFLGVANRKPAAHATETANTLARPGNLILLGLNQRDKACRAFRTASLSVSPAEAHPGISGNTADQRPVSRSSVTTNRNFMSSIYPPSPTRQRSCLISG